MSDPMDEEMDMAAAMAAGDDDDAMAAAMAAGDDDMAAAMGGGEEDKSVGIDEAASGHRPVF